MQFIKNIDSNDLKKYLISDETSDCYCKFKSQAEAFSNIISAIQYKADLYPRISIFILLKDQSDVLEFPEIPKRITHDDEASVAICYYDTDAGGCGNRATDIFIDNTVNMTKEFNDAIMKPMVMEYCFNLPNEEPLPPKLVYFDYEL